MLRQLIFKSKEFYCSFYSKVSLRNKNHLGPHIDPLRQIILENLFLFFIVLRICNVLLLSFTKGQSLLKVFDPKNIIFLYQGIAYKHHHIRQCFLDQFAREPSSNLSGRVKFEKIATFYNCFLDLDRRIYRLIYYHFTISFAFLIF